MQTRIPLVGLIAIVGVSVYAGTVLATPGSGVRSTLLAQGRFDEIDPKVKTDDWKVQIKTKGPSDLHVLENRVAPGGTFGWRSHPGPSLVIVKSASVSRPIVHTGGTS